LLPFRPEPSLFSSAVEKYEDEIIQDSNFAVVYGFETRFPTLREEHILRVFENRLLRRILD
jgi:hypothetical protein